MESVPSTSPERFPVPSSIRRGPMTISNQVPGQRDPKVFNDLSNDNSCQYFAEEFSGIQVCTKLKHPGSPSPDYQGQGALVPQRSLSKKSRPSVQPPAEKLFHGTKPAPGRSFLSRPNQRKRHVRSLLQPSKKHEHVPLTEPPPSQQAPEDCISSLPFSQTFPKKPGGCEVIPQTIEPRPEDRSTVYFTRNGVLGMPLQYMHNLNDMDDPDEPVNFGLDPMKSCQITLVIAWPGYKEATYEILVYTPLYPAAPFVTVYGLRQLTKRELAIETLRCIHRWMIEHPWNGERHKGIPEWRLSGEKSPGVSAKLVWLSMIIPVGDGRWVTQLQKAPGPA